MTENVFEAVKQSVSTRDAAAFYGIEVKRNGMACCPFHDDKNPSMKVDQRFHCFGCGEDGFVLSHDFQSPFQVCDFCNVFCNPCLLFFFTFKKKKVQQVLYMAENVFEAVKQSVSTREAAEFYGIKVSRTGMACCHFHRGLVKAHGRECI